MILFKIFFTNELNLILKSKGRVLANILYFLIILSIFQILTQNFDHNIQPSLFIIISIIALLCSIITLNHDFLEKDFRDGTLEQIIIHCQNLEIFVLAKCLANWLISCSFIIFIASVFSQIIEANILNFWHIFIALNLSSLSLFFLFALCGSLSMVGGFASMMSVVALPIAMPILIISTASVLDEFYINIKILMALTTLIICISTLGCSKIIKIANG
ncbi:MAG: hypothetical protein FJX30_03585 [Alphaproteobacteria bacterium]|nr:hypothetical protein [Alphaproteobacteria bacterium]